MGAGCCTTVNTKGSRSGPPITIKQDKTIIQMMSLSQNITGNESMKAFRNKNMMAGTIIRDPKPIDL